MPSQTDLDQGGTVREWVQKYLGPSVGWVYVPNDNILGIIAAGTTVAILGTTLVQVRVNGAVTITLPSVIRPSTTAGVIPLPFINLPITIVDVGGFAAAHPITIQPASGAETIMGLASVQITAAYGAISLRPNAVTPEWVPAT